MIGARGVVVSRAVGLQKPWALVAWLAVVLCAICLPVSVRAAVSSCSTTPCYSQRALQATQQGINSQPACMNRTFQHPQYGTMTVGQAFAAFPIHESSGQYYGIYNGSCCCGQGQYNCDDERVGTTTGGQRNTPYARQLLNQATNGAYGRAQTYEEQWRICCAANVANGTLNQLLVAELFCGKAGISGKSTVTYADVLQAAREYGEGNLDYQRKFERSLSSFMTGCIDSSSAQCNLGLRLTNQDAQMQGYTSQFANTSTSFGAFGASGALPRCAEKIKEYASTLGQNVELNPISASGSAGAGSGNSGSNAGSGNSGSSADASQFGFTSFRVPSVSDLGLELFFAWRGRSAYEWQQAELAANQVPVPSIKKTSCFEQLAQLYKSMSLIIKDPRNIYLSLLETLIEQALNQVCSFVFSLAAIPEQGLESLSSAICLPVPSLPSFSIPSLDAGLNLSCDGQQITSFNVEGSGGYSGTGFEGFGGSVPEYYTIQIPGTGGTGGSRTPSSSTEPPITLPDDPRNTG